MTVPSSDVRVCVYCVGRDELIKTGAQLVLRRKQLLAELMFIYPVEQVPVITCFV